MAWNRHFEIKIGGVI